MYTPLRKHERSLRIIAFNGSLLKSLNPSILNIRKNIVGYPRNFADKGSFRQTWNGLFCILLKVHVATSTEII